MSERPEFLDYVVLFESEPEWVHEMGWFYGARFVLRRVPDTIAPDEAEFELEWHQDGRRLINLKLVMVTEWLIRRLMGKEQLFLKATSDREVLCTITSQARGICRGGGTVVAVAANNRFESDGPPFRCAPGQAAAQ